MLLRLLVDIAGLPRFHQPSRVLLSIVLHGTLLPLRHNIQVILLLKQKSPALVGVVI